MKPSHCGCIIRPVGQKIPHYFTELLSHLLVLMTLDSDGRAPLPSLQYQYVHLRLRLEQLHLAPRSFQFSGESLDGHRANVSGCFQRVASEEAICVCPLSLSGFSNHFLLLAGFI